MVRKCDKLNFQLFQWNEDKNRWGPRMKYTTLNMIQRDIGADEDLTLQDIKNIYNENNEELCKIWKIIKIS